MLTRFLSLVFYVWLGCLLGRAQTVNATSVQNLLPNSSVSFSCLTIDEGLSSNTVRALMQDGKGYVWIGTSRGLNRFDGHRILPLRKTRSLSVTSMAEDGDSIWVGTDNGLYLYLQRTDSIRKYLDPLKKESIAHVNVSDIRMDAKGNLWMATMGQGILRLNTQTGHLTAVPAPDGATSYGCVYISKDGTVWASGNWAKANLIRYQAKKDCFEGMPLRFADGAQPKIDGIAMTEDAQGMMWLGTWNGSLIRFAPSTGMAELALLPSESQMQHIHSVIELKSGLLLVGSDKGLVAVDGKTKQTRLHSRSSSLSGALSDNFVYPLMVDREGGTWVGTYYGGVNYTHPVSGNFTSFAHSEYGNSVSGNVVNHFCEDAQNRLWIASDDGGLCYYHPGDGSFTKVPLASEGAEHNVHALAMDGNRLYVGTYAQGLDMVDVNTMQVTHVPAFADDKGKVLDASSYAIFPDRQHRIWVGMFSSVAIFHPDSRTFSDVKRVEVPVLDILQDLMDCVWVATEGNGVWAYNKQGAWKHYMDFQREDMAEGALVAVYSLFLDGQGTLWAGLANGLFRYDRQTDRFVKEPLSAEGVSVFGITAVEGHLWLATSVGVLCYSLPERKVEQIYKGGGNIASIDFLPDAVYRGYDGTIYMGTTNGFVSFKPQFMHRNEVQPKVVFTELDIFNRPVPVGGEILPERLPYLDELRLSYRESVFRVSFSAMSFLHPSDIHYSYYLEGFDEEWIDAGNQQSVTYTNISPGTYVLHVRATTNDGMESEDATLRIVITPPFYWNTPAKILYLLLIVLAIFFYVRYLLKKNEKRHVAEIQEINTQKEQEIQEINTQKEQEIQEINIQKEQEVHDARIKFMTINEKDQAFLDKMERVIEQNFSNSDLSVEYLASELNVSRSGLFAKIKALADVTPNEMIQVIRLKHAASLLMSGNYRVNEVCYMVGFSSPSYFAKCFQKQYGCTPAKYKG